MAFCRLNVVVGIAVHAVIAHPNGADRAICVLAATPPNGVLVGEHDDALVDIKGPPVIACQPRHIGWIRDI